LEIAIISKRETHEQISETGLFFRIFEMQPIVAQLRIDTVSASCRLLSRQKTNFPSKLVGMKRS